MENDTSTSARSSSSNERRRDRLNNHFDRNALKWYAASAIIIAVGSVGFYWVWFRNWILSHDPKDWALFGDFVSGAVGPAVALFAFFALLHTIRINQEELRLTRQELEASSAALQQAAHTAETRAEREEVESQKADLIRVIEHLQADLEQAIKTPLEGPLSNSLTSAIGGAPRLTWANLLEGEVATVRPDQYLKRNGPEFASMHNRLRDLENHLRAYERLASNEYFTGHYKVRYKPIVDLLSGAGVDVDQDILDFFQTPENPLEIADDSIADMQKTRAGGRGDMAARLQVSVSAEGQIVPPLEVIFVDPERNDPRSLPYVSVRTFPSPRDGRIRLARIDWAYSSIPRGGVPPSEFAVDGEAMTSDAAEQRGREIAEQYGFPTLYVQHDPNLEEDQ